MLSHCFLSYFLLSVTVMFTKYKFEIFCCLFRLTDVYRTQAVGWPHLMRGHSLIVVNAAKTGKTLTYLPAICSLLGVRFSNEI